jgi:hypothetical protein
VQGAKRELRHGKAGGHCMPHIGGAPAGHADDFTAVSGEAALPSSLWRQRLPKLVTAVKGLHRHISSARLPRLMLWLWTPATNRACLQSLLQA